MVLLEVNSACNILLSRTLEELLKSYLGKLFGVDGLSEVERDIVHQETLQFLFEPQSGVFGLKIHIKSAQDAFLLQVDVRHN